MVFWGPNGRRLPWNAPSGEEGEEKAVYIRWLQYESNWTFMLLQHNNCIQKYSVLSSKRISVLHCRFYSTYFSGGVT